MADHLKKGREIRDPVLARLVQSVDPEQAPVHFLDGVMARLHDLPSPAPLKPWSPPKWLKFGIGGTMVASLVTAVLLAVAGSGQPGSLTALESQIAGAVHSNLATFPGNWTIPTFTIPGYVTWILAGSVILLWGFWLIDRYLNKKAD